MMNSPGSPCIPYNSYWSRHYCYNMNYKRAINKRSDRADALQHLVEASKLTSDGKEWLTAALDPFHDYNHQIAGYPDADVSQTVVSCYTYEYQISKPPGLAAGATWDCHVHSLPIANSFNAAGVYNQSADWGRITEPVPTVTRQTGPLNILSGPAGSNLAPAIPTVANVVTNIMPQNGVEDISSGCSRIIGAGFEIHNTTAEIYKQGSVTTYRMPQASGDNQTLFSNNNASSFGSVVGTRFRAPPASIANANLLKGTRTWEAKDGVYATLMQSSVVNPLKNLANQHVLFDEYPDPGTASVVMGTPLIPGLPVANATTYTPVAIQTVPFDTTGAYFTGLSEQTTMVLKGRFYVERAPTWNESAIAVLASPSAGLDTTALELYAATVNMLPAAVHVGENAKGDWWRAIISVIKHVSAPLGLALSPFVPGAGLIGGAVSSIAGQIDTKKPVSTQSTAQAISQNPKAVKVVSQRRPQKARSVKK